MKSLISQETRGGGESYSIVDSISKTNHIIHRNPNSSNPSKFKTILFQSPQHIHIINVYPKLIKINLAQNSVSL